MAALVTVFGGSGFLGRRIVRHLRAADVTVRIGARHPDRATSTVGRDASGTECVPADVNEAASVAAAVAGAVAVVNAVSLYVERGSDTFRSVHVEAAAQVATLARQAGAERLVHVSGIGADATSASPYIRSRGAGEAAVFEAFPAATVIRPAVMFGPDDAFLLPLLAMLRRLPAFPLFGAGETRLQPVHVEDVGDAVARILRAPAAQPIYELAGPRVYTYAELLRTLAAGAGRQPLLLPVPFALWRALGSACEFLPNPPITTNQVDLMQADTVAAPDMPGLASLQITPASVEQFLREIRDNTGQPPGASADR